MALPDLQIPSPALGYHLLLELHDCAPACLDSPPEVESIITAAAREAGATVVTATFHHFSPHGVSGVLVIAESHIAAHTWPEYRYAAIDAFTCGDASLLERVEQLLVAGFQAQSHQRTIVQRGPLAHLPTRSPGPAAPATPGAH